MRELSEQEEQARKRICLAIDTESTTEALALASEVGPYVGMFKVGKGLHLAACNEGVPIVSKLHEASAEKGGIFLDLKLHDTPQQIYGASRASAVPGVYMFNVHVAGGKEMCQQAVKGAAEGAAAAAIERPKVIGVTVLTSLDDSDLQEQGLGVDYSSLVRRRTELAREWGLDGVVCSAKVAGELEREFGSDFLYVTPGIKWAGVQNLGQKQLYTPVQAVQECSNSILVIGSAITKADDKRATSVEILEAMGSSLA